MKSEPVHHPLIGVHDETIYHVLNDVRGQSWFDKCNALEAALVAAGWTPPDGHPLASATPSPGGWKLVPVEPTDEMIEACESALAEWRKTLPPDELVLRGKWKSGKLYHDAEQAEKHAIRYRAMLNAAPSPPTEPTGGEG